MAKHIDNVDEAYKLAHRLANKFAQNHTLPAIDADDYTQEAMIAWLTNRNMYFGMVDAFRRRAAPLSCTVYMREKALGNPVYPKFVEFTKYLEDTLVVDDRDQLEACENTLFAEQIRRYILESITDDAMQVALISYFFLGASKYKIACMLRKSQDRVSKLLKEGVAILKEANDVGAIDFYGDSGNSTDSGNGTVGTVSPA